MDNTVSDYYVEYIIVCMFSLSSAVVHYNVKPLL